MAKDSLLTQIKSAVRLPGAAYAASQAKQRAHVAEQRLQHAEFVKARKEGRVHGYKKGGKVKKTGLAKVHKGERVLTKKQAKKFDAKKFERARKKVFRLK